MGKEILTFGDIEIEENKFYHHKFSIFLGDIGKVLVSNKISFGGKKTVITLFVTCIMVKPLHIMLPKTSAYVKR